MFTRKKIIVFFQLLYWFSLLYCHFSYFNVQKIICKTNVLNIFYSHVKVLINYNKINVCVYVCSSHKFQCRHILHKLSQLFMVIMIDCIITKYFKYFCRDIIQIKETLSSSSEAELNKRLPSQKHVLLPDILQEYIAHNIIFTSNRQTGELVDEPLQPVRIYIVHNNIEITEQQYQPEYSSLNNGITYNMMVQSSKNSGR